MKKKWYKSRSIWLGIVACIYGIAKAFIDGSFNTDELAFIFGGLEAIFIRLGIGNLE